MDKINLTVVVLTKNSSKIIEDCLKSVHGWVSEIVVVDDMSSDGTLDIVRKYTDKVHTRKWDREGAHRNFAYSLAKCDYILSLDSDERVTPELRDEIINLFKEGPKFAGYNIPHRNFIGDYWIKYGGWYPNAKLKMYARKEFHYEEEAEYHPRAFLNGQSYTLKSDIIHYAYRDFQNLFSKLNHQTDFEAKKWLRDQRKMSFGRCMFKAVTRFIKFYFVKKGRKDGYIGFMMALASSAYQLMTYAKYWEAKNKKK
ncbi:MAG: glycosyltransferase family 2 protein [Candidatus Omnitrophica bacterium]|nr:glycosyltransferase family 2 protein [Candidatus Omnitrophota bacterium]MDD5501421.1 glycosyltransferase family 2 protein [Candidatus Omnitrophota bacterium]